MVSIVVHQQNTEVPTHSQPCKELVIMLGTTTLVTLFHKLATRLHCITTYASLAVSCAWQVASHCWKVHNLWLDVSHVSPSYKPSPVVAHEGWTCQLRSRIRVSPSFSWISWGFIATNRTYIWVKNPAYNWKTARSICKTSTGVTGVMLWCY
jgi:hypothetical protein